jgi:RNA polymerase primary sigma factor
MGSWEREQILADFEGDRFEVVAAPKLLDEGIDVPAADLAAILATSRSRRQMVQRMGRVLRRKEDGRIARIVVFFVEDTIEDPSRGSHEDFFDLILPAAEDVRRFSSSPEETAKLIGFLSEFGGES